MAILSSPQEIKIFDDCMEHLQRLTDPGHNIRIIDLKMDVPTLDDTMPDNERLTRALQAATGIEKIELPFSTLMELPDVLRASDFEVQCVNCPE